MPMEGFGRKISRALFPDIHREMGDLRSKNADLEKAVRKQIVIPGTPVQGKTSPTLQQMIQARQRVAAKYKKTNREKLMELPWYPEQFTRFNPSVIVSREGYEIFDKMMKDPVFKSCTKIAEIGKFPGYQMQPVNGDQATVDFLEAQLDNMIGSPLELFQRTLISTKSRYGFVVAEIIVEPMNDYLSLRKVKARPPESIYFEQDNHGNIIDIFQYSAEGTINAPMHRIVHLVNGMDQENPYGEADGEAAYDYWVLKLDMLRAWAIYLERRGKGLVLGRLPREQMAEESDNVLEILINLQENTEGVVPDDVVMEWHENNGTGATLYSNVVNYCDQAMTKAILGQSLAVTEPLRIGFGAGEATREHTETMWAVLGNDGMIEAERIREQVLRPLVRWNLPGKATPYLYPTPIKDEDTSKLIADWNTAVTGALVPPPTAEQSKYLLEQLGVPVERPIELRIGSTEAKVHVRAAGSSKAPAGRSVADVRKLEKQTKEREAKATKAIVEAFRATIDPSIEKINNLVFKADGTMKPKSFGELRNAISFYGKNDVAKAVLDSMMLRWEDGQNDARKMLNPAGKKKVKSFQEFMAAGKAVPWKRGFDVTATALTPNRARDAMYQRMYFILEREYGPITQNMYFELEMVMKGETNPRQAIANMRRVLEQSTLGVESRANTVTITALSSGYNQGRQDLFSSLETMNRGTNEPGLIIGYRYSAVLDEKTTDICESRNEEFFPVGDPDMPYPPLHYGCRSVKVPVMSGEEPWDGGDWISSDKRNELVMPMEGFGGY